jgi:hypothetical protein
MEILRVKISIWKNIIEAYHSMEIRRRMGLLKCSNSIIVNLRFKRIITQEKKLILIFDTNNNFLTLIIF